MTTPNQPPPADLDRLLGIGHFELGGSGTNYGQNIDEGFVDSITGVTTPTPFNMLSVLAEVLLKIPAELLGSFFGGLVPGGLGGGSIVDGVLGLLDPRKALQTVEDFLTWVGEVFTPLKFLVEGINAALDAVMDILHRIIQAIIAGVAGIPFFGPPVAALLQSVIQVGAAGPEVEAAMDIMFGGITYAVHSKMADQQNFTSTTLGSSYRNPSWVCRHPQADVTYPESLNGQLPVFGATGAASAGTAHTHTIDGSTAHSEPGAWFVVQHDSFGGYVTAASVAIYDTVAVIAYRNGVVDNIFLEVFREASDGSLTRLFSENITADLPFGGTADYLEYEIPDPIIAQAGERHLVRVRNSSTTANMISVAGLIQNPFSVDASMSTTGASLTAQTSYSPSEAATARAASIILPWAVLATTGMADPELSYSDDFNRSELGWDWVTDGIVVTGNRAAYGGSTDGTQSAMRVQRVNRDAQKVSANLHLADDATAEELGIRMHQDREGTQYVLLAASSLEAKIYTYESATLTEQASIDTGGTDYYSLIYDEPNDTYVALKNNEPFGLEWDASSSGLTHGDRYRFGGLQITRDSGINSGTIDNWTLSDFVV